MIVGLMADSEEQTGLISQILLWLWSKSTLHVAEMIPQLNTDWVRLLCLMLRLLGKS